MSELVHACIRSPLGFTEVVPIEYVRRVTLTEADALALTGSADCGAILKLMQLKFPGFSHLKRVKKTENGDTLVLLGMNVVMDSVYGILPGGAELIDCRTDSRDEDRNANTTQDPRSSGPYRLVRVSVPLDSPCTEDQFKSFSAVWPCVYRRPNFQPLESLPTDARKRMQQVLDIPGSCLFISPEGEEFWFKPTSQVECKGLGDLVKFTHPDGRLGDPTLPSPLSHTCMRGIDVVSRNTPPSTYLCSDFQVFVEREPCVMCGMALLHSRVSMVCFSKPRDSFGAFLALGLNCNPKLNHRFRVLQIDR